VPKQRVLQTDFSAGEIGPEIALRRDTKQYEKGAKSLLNSQALIGGGNRRRPGSLRLARKSSEFRCLEFTYDTNTTYVLVFGEGTMDAYLEDGTAMGSIVGGPWTGDIWRTMDWSQTGNVVFLVEPRMMCQVVRTTDNTWSQSDIPWTVAASGRIKQPHFKVAPDDMTITPSALTGTITLELSSPGWWVADHVGTRVRILDREIEITVVTDADTATGVVKDDLRPYQDLTVTSSAGFSVDEIVEGSVTGARGLICSIPDSTSIIVAISENLTKFTAEGLVGPNITTTIGSVADATPAPVSDWTEQAFSAVNGYADCVEIHRNRLLLGGGGGVPNGLAGSSLTDIFDFDVSDASDNDGFYETVGDASATQIVQLHSAEQLLVLTDRGPYYVPESDSTPFRPSSLAFNHFGGTWKTSRVRSADYDGGVIWTSGSLIIKATPTGDLRRAWAASEVSYLVGHMLSNMVDSCFVDNFGGGDERFGMFVNDDGTAAVMMLIAQEEIRSFTPWSTDGWYKSMCALPEKVFACVERVIDGDTVFELEVFDHSLTLDDCVLDADVDVAASGFGEDEASIVTQDTYLHLGTYPLAITNVPAGPYAAGLYYDRVIETLPPEIEGGDGSKAGEMMRITEAYINVLESLRFEVNGTTLSAYQIGEDVTAAPPTRNGWFYFTFLGWSREPTVIIRQPDPLPLTVLGFKQTVLH
jgi:hypothetical protein